MVCEEGMGRVMKICISIDTCAQLQKRKLIIRWLDVSSVALQRWFGHKMIMNEDYQGIV